MTKKKKAALNYAWNCVFNFAGIVVDVSVLVFPQNELPFLMCMRLE
jgi:hypothetical protein